MPNLRMHDMSDCFWWSLLLLKQGALQCDESSGVAGEVMPMLRQIAKLCVELLNSFLLICKARPVLARCVMYEAISHKPVDVCVNVQHPKRRQSIPLSLPACTRL